MPIALTVSRASTLLPIAAWIGTSKQLARDEFFHLGGEQASLGDGGGAVQDQRKRIDGLARDEHVELDQIAFLVIGKVIIERGIPA